MFCLQCGDKLADDQTFCTYCGAKVTAVKQNSVPTENSEISKPKPLTYETVYSAVVDDFGETLRNRQFGANIKNIIKLLDSGKGFIGFTVFFLKLIGVLTLICILFVLYQGIKLTAETNSVAVFFATLMVAIYFWILAQIFFARSHTINDEVEEDEYATIGIWSIIIRLLGELSCITLIMAAFLQIFGITALNSTSPINIFSMMGVNGFVVALITILVYGIFGVFILMLHYGLSAFIKVLYGIYQNTKAQA